MCTSFHVCEDSSVTSVRKDLTHGHGHAHVRTPSAQAHAAQDGSRQCHPAMPSASDGAADAGSAACTDAEGDFTPRRTFPALMLVPQPGTQDPGRGPAEN